MPVILFMTCPELGQANSIAAVTHALNELQVSEPSAEVHLVSLAGNKSPFPKNVTVHTVSGTGIQAHAQWRVTQPGADLVKIRAEYMHAPGFWNNLKFLTHMSTILHSEEPSEYLVTVFELVKLINETNPDLCVLDPLFDAAADAVVYCNRKSVKIVPLDARYAAPDAQGAGILKQPSIGTGFRYPLNLHDSIYNFITLIFTAFWIFLLDPKFRRLNKARHQAGLAGPLGFLVPSSGRILCMSSDPKLEIPSVVPPNISSCGPILLPHRSVAEVDPELSEWLDQGPIILIVLGSHTMFTKDELLQIKECLSVVLATRKDLRLLWKVKPLGDVNVKLDDIAEPNRVRIVNWLKPDPIAVLQTGQVAVCVNHGGSNSYHEALVTGTPQIILSGWADCHDNGVLVEWLGIGAWGNLTAAPGYEAKEMIRAFNAVLGPSASSSVAVGTRERANECKALVDAHWAKLAEGRTREDGAPLEGRHFAAFEILKLAKSSYTT